MNTITIEMSDDQLGALQSDADACGMNHSTIIHTLIADRLRAITNVKEAEGQDDFRWDEHHDEILEVVAQEREPIRTDQIAEEMRQYDAPFWRTL